MDNLARKPLSTPLRRCETVVNPVTDILPHLTENPMTEGYRKRWLSQEYARWLISFVIVLLVYIVPLVWWLWPDNTPGVELPPPAAMVVELAPVPVAPPAPADQPPGPEQAEATSPPPEPKPLPEPELEPPPIPETPEHQEPEVALNPAEEPVVVEPEPQEPPPPKPEEPLDEVPQQEDPASSVSAPPEAPTEDVQAAAPEQGVANPVVDQRQIINWQNTLMMKLNKVKRYPSRARRYRHEGVAYLRFAMDREGKVLSASIERSSGYSLLDKETLALLERAQPLPKPLADMPGNVLEFVVPVEFFLN